MYGTEEVEGYIRYTLINLARVDLDRSVEKICEVEKGQPSITIVNLI